MNRIRSESDKVSFENCCIVDGERWFFANQFNALCCMNRNNEIQIKGIIPGEYDSNNYLVSDIKYFDKKIYLIPRGASALIVYSIEKNDFKRVDIIEPTSNNKNPYIEYLKFSVGAIYENKLYMIPRTYPAIVIFDMINETLEYETEWLDMLEEYIFEGEAFFWTDYCIRNDELILAGANSDCIIRRSFTTKKYSLTHIFNDCNGYSGIEYVENKLFLASRKNGRIICIDTDEGQTVQSLVMPSGFGVKMIIGFSRLIYLNGYIYAIPLWANYFIRINVSNLSIDVIKDYDSERGESGEVATCCAWIEENQICIDNNLSDIIDCFDSSGKESRIELKLGDQFRRDYIKLFTEKGIVMYEKVFFSIGHFFECISE